MHFGIYQYILKYRWKQKNRIHKKIPYAPDLNPIEKVFLQIKQNTNKPD